MSWLKTSKPRKYISFFFYVHTYPSFIKFPSFNLLFSAYSHLFSFFYHIPFFQPSFSAYSGLFCIFSIIIWCFPILSGLSLQTRVQNHIKQKLVCFCWNLWTILLSTKDTFGVQRLPMYLISCSFNKPYQVTWKPNKRYIWYSTAR